MTRRFLPRLAARGQQRQGHRATPRPLVLEHLDARIVLSGMPDAIGLDAPVAAVDTIVQAAPETIAPVYLADDGVLHVQPASSETNIVVRQFVDYQLREVVEVEMDGAWTAFAVDQVQEIQIHTISVDQQVDVAAEIAVPVQLIEPTVVDAAFAADPSEPLVAEPVEAAVTTLVIPPDSSPEGEAPPNGGGSQNVEVSPPVISEFSSSEEAGYWEFTGRVTDDKSVEGLVVRFGGLLAGKTAVVNADGYFVLTTTFPPGTTGGVTAITTDSDGLDSNEANDWIQN